MTSRRFAGLLLVALIITLATAFAGAINYSLSQSQSVSNSFETGGRERYSWFTEIDAWPPAYSETIQTKAGYSILTRSTIGFSFTDKPSLKDPPPNLWQTVYRAGWPFPALERCDWTGSPALPTPRHWWRFTWNGFRGGLQLDFGQTSASWRAIALIPALPYIPGFIADLLFWGGLCWLVMHLTSWRQESRRLRLHQCLKCGYDLQALATCPECGTPSTTPQVPTAPPPGVLTSDA